MHRMTAAPGAAELLEDAIGASPARPREDRRRARSAAAEPGRVAARSHRESSEVAR